MAGTSAGARKRLATIKASKGGSEKLRKWAQMGGKLSSSRGFRDDPELAKRAAHASAESRRKRPEFNGESQDDGSAD